MEFRKLRIKDLIPASYNPRKKLKPGDKEFEKIPNNHLIEKKLNCGSAYKASQIA